jgi:hypothetical protein
MWNKNAELKYRLLLVLIICNRTRKTFTFLSARTSINKFAKENVNLQLIIDMKTHNLIKC